jgi:hypothetical protein
MQAPSLILFSLLCYKSVFFCVFSCRDAYDCKTDPDMAELALRLFDITIEGSDAAGNIGRDQCMVIIIPNNMTIQDAESIAQNSRVRYKIATADLGIMLDTQTNIIMKYMYDLSQAVITKIDDTHQYSIDAITANRAQKRDLLIADKERDLIILNENTATNSNFDPRKMAEVEIWKWKFVAAVGICVGVVVGICVGVVVGVKL